MYTFCMVRKWKVVYKVEDSKVCKNSYNNKHIFKLISYRELRGNKSERFGKKGERYVIYGM